MLGPLRALVRQLNVNAARMASTAIHNTNEACCTIPPVESDYTPKGDFQPYGGFDRVYVTGPDNSKNAIVCVYDIFGFFPQTQQGADIIADSLNTKVYMPDFFEPDPAFPMEKFPPKSDQDRRDLQNFFATTANPGANITKLKKFGQYLKADDVDHIGVYGFCWGGKVAMGIGSESSIFSTLSIIHPAMLSVEDAEKLALPIAIYISKDEPIEEYKKIVDVISKNAWAKKNEHRLYSNMFHGWAAARANLKNEENKKAYEDVYSRLAKFLCNTI